MKLRSIILMTLLCSAHAIAAAPADGGSAEAGQAKSTTCVACHGIDGNSVNPEWPNIAGQHASYILKQLQAFKSGARENPLMSPIALTLSEEDMADLAAFYSTQTRKGLEADPSKVELGQRIDRGGDAETNVPACSGCHGPRGTGNPAAEYPSIQGQHATYIAAQLRAYRSGQRQTDPNSMMRDVTRTMTDEQIDAVAAYVQGLR
jgi:cytochrome c553